MKSILIFIISLFLFIIPGKDEKMIKENYKTLWKKVEEYKKQGLPKTSLEFVDKIYYKAQHENNAEQYTKALIYQLALRSTYDVDYNIKSLQKLEDEIVSAESVIIRDVLHSLAAELYWNYYRHNRYKISQRSNIDNLSGDVKTWDLQTILSKALAHYQLSLDHRNETANQKLTDYASILTRNENALHLRPTLFDLLAYRALDFYQSEDYYLTKANLEINFTNADLFSSETKFIKLPLDESPENIALNLYQDLVQLHLETPDALAEANLNRLRYVYDHYVNGDKKLRYEVALKGFAEKVKESEEWSLVQFYLADFYNGEPSYGVYEKKESFEDRNLELTNAVACCDQAILKYPKSFGASKALVLKREIERKNLQIEMERAVLPDEAFPVAITYKNIKNIYWKIVAVNPDGDWKDSRMENNEKLRFLKKQPVVVKGEEVLANEIIYHKRKTELIIPGIENGFYVLITSSSPDFATNEEVTAFSELWVTNITFAMWEENRGKIELTFLDRKSGATLKNITAKFIYRSYDYKKRSYNYEQIAEKTTDNQGVIWLKDEEIPKNAFYLDIHHADDRFVTSSNFYVKKEKRNSNERIAVNIFTDRVLYRPGQTVHFKGIVLGKVKQKAAVIKSGWKDEVVFYDMNHEVIQREAIQTNAFGSFSGSFIIPEQTLNGRYRLKTKYGSVYVNVEAYRRPTFTIKTNPVKGTYKLNETVSVSGETMALAGYPLQDAEISYEVSRKVRFPFFRYFIPQYNQQDVVLTSGEVTSDEKGVFTIDFKAIPDVSIDKEDDPVFYYSIKIKAVDQNGETHETQTSVAAGYSSFIPSCDVSNLVNNQDELVFKPLVKNLSGEEIEAHMKVKISKLSDFEALYVEKYWTKPDQNLYSSDEYHQQLKHFPFDGEGNLENLKVIKEVFAENYDQKNTEVKLDISDWNPGAYRMVLDVSKGDEAHQVVKNFVVFHPNAKKTPLNQFSFFRIDKALAHPGESVQLLIGTAAKKVEAYIRAEHDGKIFFEKKIKIKENQQQIEIPVTADQYGGFSVHAFFQKENRVFSFSKQIDVPYDHKQLVLKLEVNKTPLTPGGKEEWTLHIKQKGEQKEKVEILAGMYDASLDELIPANPWRLSNLRPQLKRIYSWGGNPESKLADSRNMYHEADLPKSVRRVYPQLNWFDYNMLNRNLRYARGMEVATPMAKNSERMSVADIDMEEEEVYGAFDETIADKALPEPKKQQQPKIRTNFDETAFFYPQLVAADSAKISFELPESLTEWKFMTLAHTQSLKTGTLMQTFEARKELMIVPNAPRFVRQNDKLVFTAKVVNLTNQDQEVTVTLDMLVASRETIITETLGLKNNQRKLTVNANGTELVSFELDITAAAGLLKYRITATTENFSDGKEDFLPVLTNKKRLTVTKAFTLNDAGNVSIEVPEFDARNAERLTVEYTGNAAWYAVQAMPYLNHNDPKSATAIAEVLFVNSLGKRLVDQHPKIEQVFKVWKNLDHDALLSNLEKNQELKNVMIEYTPWLLDAKEESANKKKIANFFDKNTLNYQQNKMLEKLSALQMPDGGWSWYNGMKSNQYITQSIILKLSELQEVQAIGQDEVNLMISDGMRFCANKIEEKYMRMKARKGFDINNYIPTPTEVLFIYTLSMNADKSLTDSQQSIIKKYTQQLSKKWLRYNQYLQGIIAMTFHKNNEDVVSEKIVNSLRQHAILDDEGMYWRDFDGGWLWYQAPIDFQAMMIRVFEAVSDDASEVEKLKLYLIKQKQTQKWPTSSATAKAVFALLTSGQNELDVIKPQTIIQVGNQQFDLAKEKTEAGTGYFKKVWNRSELKDGMEHITIEKSDNTVSWGAAYYQFYQDLKKVKSHAEGVSVKKEVYKVEQTNDGEKLIAIDVKNIKVGDKLRIRLEMRSDKNLQFVHLNDGFASGFEGMQKLSGYHYQDGLIYYQSMNDASADFFIEYMPKGTFVMEYDVIAEQSGHFTLGIATLQSMYAPEFAAHSQGGVIAVE